MWYLSSQSDFFHLADTLPCLSIHVVTSGKISSFLWLHNILSCVFVYVCIYHTFPYPFVYGWTQVLSVGLLEEPQTLNIMWDEGAPWCPQHCPGAGAQGDLGRAWLRRRKAAGVLSLVLWPHMGWKVRGHPPLLCSQVDSD